MKRSSLFLTLLLLFFSAFSFAQQASPVKVDSGFVETIEDGLISYKSIPLAAIGSGGLPRKEILSNAPLKTGTILFLIKIE